MDLVERARDSGEYRPNLQFPSFELTKPEDYGFLDQSYVLIEYGKSKPGQVCSVSQGQECQHCNGFESPLAECSVPLNE